MVIASDKGGNFTPAPAGSHVARCVHVIDIGTHSFTWQGKTTTNRKVRLAWELPEEKYDAGPERGETSFLVSKEFTLSLNAKANLRHLLESWRGREFSKEELAGFDIGKLLGQPCLLTIVHKQTSQGKTVADVSTASRLPKKMECPPQVYKSIEYSVDQGVNEVFRNLPQWMQDKCRACQEWQKPSESESGPESNYDPEPPGEDDNCPF